MGEALSAGTVSLGVKPETKGFGAKLAEGIRGESGGLGGLGSELGGKLLAGLGTIGIAVGVGEFIKKGVEEYSAADALNAQFAAGIKSTGNAAGLSVKGMDDLAKSISGYSGQAYDSIGKTEQVLQTFQNIKNVGPNKIFDQTTTAAANMAAKLGTDASAAARQLGVALNDPTKGMARLTRVGVTFTKSQTDQIKAMQASGNLMGAQQLILDQLTIKFGGAAKAAGQTLPGEIARSKVAFGELTKAVVSGVMPFVTPAIEGIANLMTKATPGIEHFSGLFSEKLGKSLKDLQPLFHTVGKMFSDLGPTFAPLIGQIVSLASSFSPVSLVIKSITPVLPQLAAVVAHLASTLAGDLGKALKVILPIISHVAGILAGDLGKVLVMLMPVVAKIAGILSKELGKVLIELAPVIVKLAEFVGHLLTAVSPLIPVVLNLVMAFIPLLDPLIQLANAILTPLIALLVALLPPIMDVVKVLVAILVPAIQVVSAIITWLITNSIAGFMSAFGAIGGVVHGVGDAIGTVFGAIGGIIKGAFNGVVDFVKGIFNTIIGVVNGIIDGINGATSLAGAIGIHIGAIPHLPGLADSGTVLPTPGGTIVRVAEGGKAESVVDTGKLNRLIDSASSNKNGSGFPESVTLVDADGSILARTHVIAKDVSSRTLNASLRGA